MKSHRGLSSVVGAVFLIAIVIGALSYISYSIDIMGNFSEALITEESRIKDKQREAFEVTSIDITAANKLDGVIKNTGQVPVKTRTSSSSPDCQAYVVFTENELDFGTPASVR